MIKKLTILFCALTMLLTGCGGGSVYDDASADVPGNWANYTVGGLQFKFEAGWKSGSWDILQSNMDYQVQAINTSNNLAIFGRLVGPASDKGTVNYIDFGYFEMGRTVETAELENIMEQLNDLGLSLKKMGADSEDKQSSRIRCYGDDELEALTVSYLIEQDPVSCVIQTALIARGTRVYMISYADFASDTDDSKLEQLLTSLDFVE